VAHGGVLLVPVRVQGQDVEFLVDTGSAYTALSRDLVALLTLTVDLRRTATIVPAHGAMFKVPVVTIAELRLGGFRMTNVEAVMLEFPHGLQLDGILGMNVLK
jgi:clan AA aspartic protease (TIGR02281 family)